MKKLKMARGVTLIFEEGCNKYLENCRQRNLREGTIEHYRQSYVQFYIMLTVNQVHHLTILLFNDIIMLRLYGMKRNGLLVFEDL